MGRTGRFDVFTPRRHTSVRSREKSFRYTYRELYSIRGKLRFPRFEESSQDGRTPPATELARSAIDGIDDCRNQSRELWFGSPTFVTVRGIIFDKSD